MVRKFKKSLFLCLIIQILSSVGLSAKVSFGNSSLFNEGWAFMQDDPEGAHAPEFDDSKWRKLDLPHDWSVEGVLSPDNASCTGFLPAGIGWYRKHFHSRQISDKNAYIYFEGVYNRSTVYLNGHQLGYRPSGYNSFMYDLTPYLKDGDNVIAVRVDHSRKADSRWYSGSGIYRDVWLVQAGDTHFVQWGVGYHAKSVIIGKSAVLSVDAAIEGLPEKGATLRLVLRDADGKIVASSSVKAKSAQVVDMKVKNPQLWDIESPYLYTLEASILSGKKVCDCTLVNVGIRTLEFNPDKGFALNGRNMKIKGVCLHHDAGVLGSVVPDEVWERRLLNLKKIGTNAIRTSHNPQAPGFYDLCDRLGFLVMDEAFDEWEFNKRKWVEGWNVGTPHFDGTADYFDEWCERDVKDMVRRDRNHPSIFMWSIGNEVDYPNDPYSHPVLDGDGKEFTQPVFGGYSPDAPDAERIGVIGHRLAGYVRSIDTSRPVTGALAGVVMSNQTTYPDALDVVGYNYTEGNYQKDHEKYPDRVIYGSENRSDFHAWKAVRDNEFISGQFIWTGIDYLGESNAWPSRGFYSGLLDFAGNIKPRGYFRASLWCENPVCYIGTYPKPKVVNRWNSGDSFDAEAVWNYEDGQMIRVVCYTNAAQAQLLLNGEVVGQMIPYNDETGIIGWDVPYAEGVLVAEGYDADGNKVSSHEIRSSLRPYALSVSADKTELMAGGEVAHVFVRILDDKGNLVTLGDNDITCTIDGPGELLGLESGNNTDMADWTDNRQRAFKGGLLAYVRTGKNPGKITVRFSSPLLKGAEIGLVSHNYTKTEDIFLSDPFIYADEGTGMYYMTGTGGLLWKSTDLKVWDGPFEVAQTDPTSWMGPKPMIWAAELHKYNGKYYYFGTFTNNDNVMQVYRGNDIHRRACHILVGDSPEGPFRPMEDKIYLPADQPTLDATLWIEDGQPYLLFCHEWLQNWNGTVESIRLKPDFSGTFGERDLLFTAFDSPWSREKHPDGSVTPNKVTDGPYVFKTQTGKLGMIWTSWTYGDYNQGVAYSESGKLEGPWVQEKDIITPPNFGHGMIFRTFDGKLLLCCHSHLQDGFRMIRQPAFFLLDDSGDKLKVKGRYNP